MAFSFLRTAVLILAVVCSVLGQSTVDTATRLLQLQKDLPACALKCSIAELPRFPCTLTDLTCICTNQDLNNALLICLSQSCSIVEQLQTKKATVTACGAKVRNRSRQFVFATWPLYSIAILAVAIRFAGRLQFFGGQHAWDDHLMLLSLATLTVLASVGQILINIGIGQDIWMLSTKQIQDLLFYFWIGQFVYCLLVGLTKMSILLLYLRIFQTKVFRWQCWALIAFSCLYGIAGVVVTGVLCTPIEGVWKSWDGEHPARCVNINALTFAVAGINMSLDIIIAILPLSQLRSLQMQTTKKFAVAAMFLVGLFVTICSGIRLGTIFRFQKTSNPTYDYVSLAIWSMIEGSASVICACMPGIANAVRRFWPKLRSTYADPKLSQNVSDGSQTLDTGDDHTRVAPSKKIRSRTTVSISYADLRSMPSNISARSDELELTPATPYRQHEAHTRYSEESGNDDRKYGYVA